MSILAMFGMQLPTYQQWRRACDPEADTLLTDLEINHAWQDKSQSVWPIHKMNKGRTRDSPMYEAAAANGQGFVHLQGNVAEWVRDLTDPLRQSVVETRDRWAVGGSCCLSFKQCGINQPESTTHEARRNQIGIRPARALD